MNLDASGVNPRHTTWGPLSLPTSCGSSCCVPGQGLSWHHHPSLSPIPRYWDWPEKTKVMKHTMDHSRQGWKWAETFPTHLLCSFTWNDLCYQCFLWDLKHLPWNRGNICRTEKALFSCFRKSEKLTVQRKLFIQHDAISLFSWSILSFHLILFLFFSRHFCKSVLRNGQCQCGYLQDCAQRNSDIPKPCAREKIHHYPQSCMFSKAWEILS